MIFKRVDNLKKFSILGFYIHKNYYNYTNMYYGESEFDYLYIDELGRLLVRFDVYKSPYDKLAYYINYL